MNRITTSIFVLFTVLSLALFNSSCSDETGDGDNSSVTISTLADVTVMEGNNVLLTISLSESSTNVVTVDYATEDGTAVAGTDYVNASETLTFQAGETSKTITINTLADSDFQEANKEFTIEFSNATNASIGTNTTTVTLQNLEEPSGYYISGNFNGEFKLFQGNTFPSGDASQLNPPNPSHIYNGSTTIFVDAFIAVGLGFTKILPEYPEPEDIVANVYNTGSYNYSNADPNSEGAYFGMVENEVAFEEEGAISWNTEKGTQPSSSNFTIVSSETVVIDLGGGFTSTTKRITCEFDCTIFSLDADPITITDGRAFLVMPNDF